MDFNEIVQQFQHNVFGNLTTIRSFRDKNKIWFIGKEIQEFLGHTNITKAIKDAKLTSDERLVLKKINQPKFFNELTNQSLVGYGKRSSSITFVSESGLYKLILRSNKSEVDKFRNWVTADVLPSLRKSVEDDLVMKQASIEIGKHIDEQQQREESKIINGINMKEGGKTQTMKYSIRNCVDHDDFGRTPKEVIKWGEEIGLTSSQITSSKQVFRVTNKPVACSMSFHDNLVSNGINYDKALEISNGVGKELFKQLLEIGFKPKELNQ